MPLWSSDDCAQWLAALEGYPGIVEAQGVRGLPDLDRWYREELPKLLRERKRPYVSVAELGQITTWKMKRGVWRERNRQLVLGNPPALVRQVSRDALAAVPDLRRPIAVLCELGGVGPATASALLAAYRPDLYPFFDELVANQIPGLGPCKFTMAFYQVYAARLRERAEQLRTVCPGEPWTAHSVSQALWAASGGKAGSS